MGTLYVVSTPIGNIDDISIRALKTLLTVQYIACEDTRRTGQLLELLVSRFPEFLPSDTFVKPKFISYHDKNELQMVSECIRILEEGTSIALVSDAGTPLISDPGYVLLHEAMKRAIPIVILPGASALLPAVQLSGFSTNHVLFLGYLPEKSGNRNTLLGNIHSSSFSCTVVFYCAPHKLITTLKDVSALFASDTRIAIIRELTKVHEEVWKGTLAQALKDIREPKGEYVVCLQKK